MEETLKGALSKAIRDLDKAVDEVGRIGQLWGLDDHVVVAITAEARQHALDARRRLVHLLDLAKPGA